MKAPAALSAAILLLLVAFGHVMRVIMGIDLVVAGVSVSQWPSVVAAIVCAYLAVWVLKERKAASGQQDTDE